MPTYQITAPDGKTYAIEGPAGASQDQVISAVLAQHPNAASAVPEEQTFMGRAGRALKQGIAALPESAAGIALGAKSALGMKEAAGEQAAGIRKEAEAEAGKPAPISWEEIEKTYGKEGLAAALKKAPAYLTEQVLQSAPSMAVPLAAAAGAGAVSGPFAPIVAPAVGIGTYGLQQFGSMMRRQAEEGATGDTLSAAKAGTAAALTAPIGFFADKFTLGLGKVPSKVVGDQVLKELAKRAGNVAKGAGIGIIAEAPTEVLEQAAERWQAGLDLTGDDAKREYKEAFFGAAAVGGTLGGASRLRNAPEAKPAVPTTPTGSNLEQQAQAARERNAQIAAEQQPAPVEIPPLPATYAELEQQKQSLLQGAKTPEVKARLAEIKQAQTALNVADVKTKAQDITAQAGAGESAFAAQEPQQMEMRGATVEQPAGVTPPEPQAIAPETPAVDNRPPEKQMRLPLKTTEEAPARTLETAIGQNDMFGKPLEETTAPQSEERKQLIDQFDTLTREMNRLRSQFQSTTDNTQRAEILKKGDTYQTALNDITKKVQSLDAGKEETIKSEGKQLGFKLPQARAAEPVRQLTIQEPPKAEVAPVEQPAAEITQPVSEPKLVQKPVALAPETVPTKMSPDVLGALGIGPSATMRKPDHGIHQLDIAKPEEAVQVKTMLDMYKQGKSEPIVKKIDAYLARPEFAGVNNAQVQPAKVAGANKGPAGPSVRVPNERQQVPAKLPSAPQAAPLGPIEQATRPTAGGKGKKLSPLKAEDKAPKIELPKAREGKQPAHGFGKPGKPLKPAYEVEALEDTAPKANKETSGLEARVEPEIESHVKSGDTRKALRAIVDSTNPKHTDLNKAVAKRLLSSDKLPTIEVVEHGSLGSENGSIVAGQYDPKTDRVKIDAKYVNSETMLHEVIHGFVHTLIDAHVRGDISNPGVSKLQTLYNELKANHPELADKYGMTTLSEFASEAMSNQDFQDALRDIPSRRESNVFTEFVKRVLQILGLSPTDRLTALASAVIHTDSILKEGRKLQESATGKEGSIVFNKAKVESEFGDATVAAIEEIQSRHTPEMQAAVNSLVNNGLAGNTEARKKSSISELFRQATVDKFATVESKVSQMFSKGVRDAFGNLNPMVLARQAVDYAKFTTDFFASGGIRISKDGIFETYKNDASMEKAMTQINALAKKEGVTYEKMKERLSTVLEGHRLFDLRENHNKLLEQSAKQLEAQGKTKEAKAERENIITLHMTNAEIDTLEKAYNASAGLKEIHATLNSTRKSAIDFMVATGRITAEQGKYWKDNAAYVPFDRVFEDVEGPVRFARGNGLAVVRDIPGMKGSLGRPVGNVFDAYAKRLGWMVETSMSNYASVQVLDAMALTDFATKLKNKGAAKNQNLVVPRLFKDGKPAFYEVQNEYDMLAFQQSPEIMSGLVKALSAVSRVLRVSITALPPFAISQVVQDAQRAAILSGVKRPMVVAARTLYNFPIVFWGEVTGRKSASVRALEKFGTVGDFDGNIYQPASDIEKKIGATKRGAAGSIFHVLEQFTKASDLAARTAVYEETMRDTNDEVLAQSRARELINFSRKGSSASMRTASRIIPFFNAYAQGMDLLYRAASGKESVTGLERSQARKLFYSRMAMMTAMGFAFALTKTGDSDDDKWYQETDESVRDNNWVLTKDFKIPLPKEFGFVFKAIPERIVSYMHRNGTDEEQSILSLLGGIVATGFSAYGSPTAVPSAIRPILENMTNYSFFLQRELESTSQKKLEPGYRTASGTSEFAKMIGRLSAELPVPEEFGTALQVSPVKVDNLLKGLLGTAAVDVLMLGDAVLNPNSPDRPIHKLPFASTFMYDPVGSDRKSEFYNLRERVGGAKSTFDSLKATDPQAAAAFMEKNANLLSVEPMVARTLKQLSELRRMRNLMENGTPEMLGISGKERAEYIKEIKESENEVVSYIRTLEKEIR